MPRPRKERPPCSQEGCPRVAKDLRGGRCQVHIDQFHAENEQRRILKEANRIVMDPKPFSRRADIREEALDLGWMQIDHRAGREPMEE